MFLPSRSEHQQTNKDALKASFRLGHAQILTQTLINKTHWVRRCCPLLWPVNTAPRSAGPTDCRRSPRRSSPLAAAAAAAVDAAEGSEPRADWAHLGEKQGDDSARWRVQEREIMWQLWQECGSWFITIRITLTPPPQITNHLARGVLFHQSCAAPILLFSWRQH